MRLVLPAPIRVKAPRQDEAVSPGLHRAVLERDRFCFLFLLDPHHVCYTRFGNRHEPDDKLRLTVDHFWLTGARLGRRAPSDLEHLVALCAIENNRPPSHKTREAERDYVEGMYPGAREREREKHGR